MIHWFSLLLISTFILHMAHKCSTSQKRKWCITLLVAQCAYFTLITQCLNPALPAIKQRGVSSLRAHHSYQLLLSRFSCCNSCRLHLNSTSAHRIPPARDTFIWIPRSEPSVYRAGWKCSGSTSITARGAFSIKDHCYWARLDNWAGCSLGYRVGWNLGKNLDVISQNQLIKQKL